MGVELATTTGSAISYEMMEDVNFTDSELAHFVRDALKSVSLGDIDSYNHLIGVIHHDKWLSPDEVALLVTSLKALSGAVYYIQLPYHESLLDSIFRMSIWNYGPDVMDAIIELVISLAGFSGKLVDSCLDMLVRNFMPPPAFVKLLKEPRGLVKKEHVLYKVHEALRKIADLVPLAPLRLVPVLNQRMPYINRDESLIAIYVENMLKLESSAIGGIVGSSILMAVVDRLIELDVEIGWDDILDDSSKGMFLMELEDLEESVDGVENEYGEITIESLSRKRVGGKTAEKLDNLMVLTFEHLESCAKAGRLAEVFETLVRSFQMTVLNAHKSKFAQFVMFYACSLDAEGCGVKFAEKLADIFVGNVFPLTRMSAVAYLASYLSRGKFVSSSLVVSMLERLCSVLCVEQINISWLVTWCLEYCQFIDGDVNPSAHRVFYSGCQAVMYLLCFRMRSMMKVPRLKSRLLLMPIEQILRHPLSPLKVCLPSIVQEYLQQAKEARLFTVSETFIFDDLLESELSRAFGGLERLDMFFPFDPCLLRKSDRFIRPNFVYWWMVSTDDDKDEHDLDEFSSDDDEHDLGDTFDKMSITPRISMPSRIRPSVSPESL